MSKCRVGEICDSSWMVVDAATMSSGSGSQREARPLLNLVQSGAYAKCLMLRDDYTNTRRLLPALGTVTVAGGVFTLWSGGITPSVLAASPSSVSHKSSGDNVLPMATGVLTAVIAGWGAYEFWHLRNVIPKNYKALNCDEVIAAVQGRATAPLFESASKFQEIGSCSGVDVLVGNCVPPRYMPSAVEWSTEPLTPQQVALGAGVVIVGAVAVYTGVAEAAALAEWVASWGWVPALAL